MTKAAITVKFDEDQYEAIERLAKAEERTFSGMVRLLVRRGLELRTSSSEKKDDWTKKEKDAAMLDFMKERVDRLNPPKTANLMPKLIPEPDRRKASWPFPPTKQEKALSAHGVGKKSVGASLANDTFCSVCRAKQFLTPSGITCRNGHGGAPGLTLEEVKANPLPPRAARQRVCPGCKVKPSEFGRKDGYCSGKCFREYNS